MQDPEPVRLARASRRLIAALLIFLFSSCHKDNPVVPATPPAPSAMRDAASCIAEAISLNAGGLIDQIGDVSDITAYLGSPLESGRALEKAAVDSVNTTFTSAFDSTTGWWTLDLARQRIGDNRTATYTRHYRYQFRNRDSIPQRDWLTGTDTAYYVDFRIIGGTGVFVTSAQSSSVDSLTGAWLVTNANTGTFSMTPEADRPYRRVGTDTIKADSSSRALRGNFSLGTGSVMSPRGSRLFLQSKTSGTISGWFDAGITFFGDSLYADHVAHFPTTVTFGNGAADIAVGGTHFRLNLTTGVLQ
jgi:hypothetical protein